MHYIKILRPVNLALIVVMMGLVKFGFLTPLSLPLGLNLYTFIAMVLATLFITGAGNIINDIHDQEIDAINKPKKRIVGVHISENTAYSYYLILTTLGVLLGFYVANVVGRPSFALVFILASALLYVYASLWKRLLLIGNLLISFLVGLTVLLFILFDLIPAISDPLDPEYRLVTRILLLYALFAFSVNLIREIIKDLIDINGDHKGQIQSLAILLGRKRTTHIVLILLILFTFGMLATMYTQWYANKTMVIYTLFLVIGPLFITIYKAYEAKTLKDYRLISTLLKGILLTGMGTLLFYPELLS